MSEPKLTYGLSLQTQRLVSIDSVPRSGKECGLVCPDCKQPLVAKKGHKQERGRGHAPHFAHLVEGICNPQKAFESEVHLLAKQIIFDTKMVAVPTFRGNYIIFDARRLVFSEVTLEKQFDNNLRPDCVGTFVFDDKKTEIWIEICNTHAVDPHKQSLIKRNHISCIEIDVAEFVNGNKLDEEALARYLLCNIDPQKRRWINFPWDTFEIGKRVAKLHKATQEEIHQKQWNEYCKKFHEEDACRRVNAEQNKVRNEVLRQEWLAKMEKDVPVQEENKSLTVKVMSTEASEKLRIEKNNVEEAASREQDFVKRGEGNINYYLTRSMNNLKYAKEHKVQELIDYEEQVAIPLWKRILSQITNN